MTGKVQIEITYCVGSRHLGTAAWLATEFFQHFGPDAAVTISPRDQNLMEVIVDGERIYDNQAEGNHFPDLARIHRMLGHIREKIAATGSAADGKQSPQSSIERAMREAEDGVNRILSGEPTVKLSPQNYHIRRLQHLLGQRSNVASTSQGREPERSVLFYRE